MKKNLKPSTGNLPHIPIMRSEVIRGFENVDITVFYDGTVGAGGHASEILTSHPEIVRYIGCDKDPEALMIAEKALSPWSAKVELIHGNFADLDAHISERKIKEVDGFFLT